MPGSDAITATCFVGPSKPISQTPAVAPLAELPVTCPRKTGGMDSKLLPMSVLHAEGGFLAAPPLPVPLLHQMEERERATPNIYIELARLFERTPIRPFIGHHPTPPRGGPGRRSRSPPRRKPLSRALPSPYSWAIRGIGRSAADPRMEKGVFCCRWIRCPRLVVNS
jgi:hypothetical protein